MPRLEFYTIGILKAPRDDAAIALSSAIANFYSALRSPQSSFSSRDSVHSLSQSGQSNAQNSVSVAS